MLVNALHPALEVIVKSDKESHGTVVNADKISILGRVVWVGKRL